LFATCRNIACIAFIYFVEFISLPWLAPIYSDIFIRIPSSHTITIYAPSWYTNFESFMCTTSFPSRSIESFCLLFSSFYDLTPKAGKRKRTDFEGEKREMQGNVCPEVWQHGATQRQQGVP